MMCTPSMSFRRIAVALAAIVLVAPLAGSAEPLRHRWTPSDRLRVGFVIEPATLNPVIGIELAASNTAQLIFDGLVHIDDRGRPVPDLAKAVPSRANGGISADGKTLTYHLDARARWHDGVPVTAEDVVFTYAAIMNPANNVRGRHGYDQIASIDALDARTVRIRFKQVFAPATLLFAGGIQGAIVPKHLLAAFHDLNKIGFNSAPIGSGPYVVREWRHGDRLLLDANPAYFRGAPRIPHVDIRFVPDSNTLLTLVRTHEIDFTPDLDPNQVAAVRRMPGVALRTKSGNAYRHIGFNTRRSPTDDWRVRRALCYALDPHLIYRKMYLGIGEQAPADQNPATGWANAALHYYPTDLARAAALLDAAGWRNGPDGVRLKNGRRLSLQIVSLAGAKTNEAIELLLQDAWHRIGVDATIKNYAGSMLFGAARPGGGLIPNGQYDVSLFSFYRNPDPDDSDVIGPSSIPPAGQNTSFYANPEVGRLQAQAVRTFDERRRHALYNRIQAIIVRDVPIYTLLWVPIIAAFNDDLHGVSVSPAGPAFWNVTTWRMGAR